MAYSLSGLGFAVRYHSDTSLTTQTGMSNVRTKIGETGTISMSDFFGTVNTSLSGLSSVTVGDTPTYTVTFTGTATYFNYIRDTSGNIYSWDSSNWSVIRPAASTGNNYSYTYNTIGAGTATISVRFLDRYNTTSSILITKTVSVSAGGGGV